MFLTQRPFDCIVVGAGFSGLACATVLARRGFGVRVLEKKASVGEKLRTTGIVVREAVEELAILDGLRSSLVTKIPAVRLYAPNMRSVRLESPDYYFLATDTPGLMHWLAGQAGEAGVEIKFRAPFAGALRAPGGWDLGGIGNCRFLVGADGANSAVACALGLGTNAQFLHGIEHEYSLDDVDNRIHEPDALHCFVDHRLAPGYIAWMLEGIGHLQIGLAHRAAAKGLKSSMRRLLEKVEPVVSLAGRRPVSVRAGPIPCGGPVRRVSTQRAMLVGDAAGLVSPLTAGGIHTALRYGQSAGHAIADFLEGRLADPGRQIARCYPQFRSKRLLRLAFDHLQSDTMMNALLSTPLMASLARRIYFHR